MGVHCCHDHDHEPQVTPPDGAYRKVLWIALLVNAGMFLVEVISGLAADSLSLLADSLDFFGDAANYGVSLWVLGMGVAARAQASLLKAATMMLFGVWILASTVWHWLNGVIPDATTMGIIGALALLANLGVAALLYAYREGDSNMRSVWLCTRNDALGNIAILLAALGVFGTGSALPDLGVALMMASLALTSAWQVISQARRELSAT